MRSTGVLVIAAGIGYVTGALVHNPLLPSTDPLAFAQPVSAAEASPSANVPAAASLARVPGGEKLRRSDTGIEDPRECDLPNGISTSCIFMD
jgi:hypothetical protein